MAACFYLGLVFPRRDGRGLRNGLPLGRQSAHDDLKFVADANRRGKLEREQSGKTPPLVRGRNWNVGHSADHAETQRVRVCSRKCVTGIKLRGELDYLRRIDCGPIEIGDCTQGGVPPVDHDFVGVAE